MSNLKLVSDFSEHYDVCFDNFGYEFRRVTTDGPNRIGMFNLFRRIGLRTPVHGFYNNFKDFGVDSLVVVHTDITKHRGEGKLLKKLGELTDSEKKCFLVQYIQNPLPLNEFKSQSDRLFFVGSRCFYSTMVSYESWLSNMGDGNTCGVGERVPCPLWRNKIHFPMFAVDFVGEPDCQYAIDFNVAPGLEREVSKLIPPSQIVLELKYWFKKYFNGEFDNG